MLGKTQEIDNETRMSKEAEIKKKKIKNKNKNKNQNSITPWEIQLRSLTSIDWNCYRVKINLKFSSFFLKKKQVKFRKSNISETMTKYSGF